MKFYNLMSGTGFIGGAYHHDWIFAWVALAFMAIVTYVLYVLSKNDYMGEYSWPASLMGIMIAFCVIAFTGSSKIALLVGIIIMLLFGYGYPRLFGSG